MELLMEKRVEKINKEINKGICLFGAGANGIWCLDYLKRNGVKVLAFIDNNMERVGEVIDQIPIISYDCYIENYVDKVILITAKHCANQILCEHFENELLISFDTWFISKYEKDYRKLHFNDTRSYEVLEQIIITMQTAREENLYGIAESNQYFALAPFFNTGKEVYADLGAYTGDTLEKFLFAHNGAFEKIYAFEPGRVQYNALVKRLDRLEVEWALDRKNIECIMGACGEKRCVSYMQEMGNFTSMQIAREGIEKVETYSLDDFFGELGYVSSIKADIEGSEYDMLLGAKNIIKRCRPKMALSVYHKPDDLLRMYYLISQWNLDYKFALRHHSTLMMETTLYCWV